MSSSERYHDLRKSFKMAQAYADMIRKRWTREYLPQGNQRSKWSKEHVQNLKEGELVWLIDDSLKRGKYKFGRIIEIFTGNDGVLRSARVKMAKWRAKPASREVSASILRWCFRDRKQGRRCWRHFRSATKAIREQRITFETDKT